MSFYTNSIREFYQSNTTNNFISSKVLKSWVWKTIQANTNLLQRNVVKIQSYKTSQYLIMLRGWSLFHLTNTHGKDWEEKVRQEHRNTGPV